MPKLTVRTVTGLKPSSRDTILWDEDVAGFGVRVKPSGVKSYLIQYRNRRGQSRRFTIGRDGLTSPEEARRKAKKLLVAVSEGSDPASDKVDARQAPTVAMLGERYMAEHASVKKKPSSARMDDVNLRTHVLPALGRLTVRDVARSDIAQLHHEMRATPGAANRVLALLSKMFNLAEVWGLRPDGSNPCRHVERYRENKCERFLSADELGRLGATLSEAEKVGAVAEGIIAAIRLLIFTGARLGEVLTLRWQYVDFERRSLRLPDSKTGAKTIYLNPPALQVLEKLRDGTAGSEWVLKGRLTNGHLVGIRKAWYRLRSKASLEDVRIHDLRHSFASVGAASGLSLPVIGRLLGHTQAATTQRYAHLASDPLQQASDLVGERLAGAMQGSSGGVVVPLRRGA